MADVMALEDAPPKLSWITRAPLLTASYMVEPSNLAYAMKYREIDLNDLGAVLRSDVWLTRGQLADLFGVYYGTITANIKVLIRSGAVWPSFKGTVIQVGNTVLPELYDMEMVVALAFRLNTPAVERVRRYVVRRVSANGSGKLTTQIFLSYGAGAVVN